MPLFRQSAPVTICPGFHLHAGERVTIRVIGPNGSEYEVTGMINVITGSKHEDDEASVVETLVLLED